MLDVQPAPLTSVVVVTWRGAGHLADCLDALAAQRRPHRTIVVDNASDDGSSAVIAAHPSTPFVLRLTENRGYAGGIDAALSEVNTPFVAWLNDDAAPHPDWLGTLEDTLVADPSAAAVSARLEHADGEVQSLGVRLSADGHGIDVVPPEAAKASKEPAEASEVFGFCGGAAVIRADALRAIGGVPAGYFCYYEDTDTSWRLRLTGWRVLAVPTARVRHLHGASTEPGSARFHHWNERNRLVMLLRCAPPGVAARELLRFALITALLPVRRLRSRGAVPAAPNFQVRLRLGALAGVLAMAPSALRARHRIGSDTTVPRRAVWRQWAGS